MATFFQDLPPEIASTYDALERRRQIQDALISKAINRDRSTQYTPGKYSMAVPYGVGQGLTELAEAYILSRQKRKQEDDIMKLGEKYRTGRDKAVNAVMDAAEGRQYPTYTSGEQAEGPFQQVEPDYRKAAFIGTASPYSEAQRMGEMAYGFDRANNRGSAPKARPIQTTSGYIDWNPETQRYEPVLNQEGKPYMPSFADPSMRYQMQYAGTEGEGMAKRYLEMPQATSALDSTFAEQLNIRSHIDNAISKADAWTTGLAGMALSKFAPGSEAWSLRGDLDTIKAGIGLEALSELRAAGGTLGQVTEAEHKLLQDKWEWLNQATNKDDFIKRLNNLLTQMDRSWTNVKNAYKRTYGVDYQMPDYENMGNDFGSQPESTVAPAANTQSGAPPANASPKEIADYYNAMP